MTDLPKLDAWLYVRVPEELKKQLEVLASKDRRKLADFIRVTLEKVANGEH